MATRYGVLPSSFLGLSIQEWSFNICVAKVGQENDKREKEKRERR